MPAATHGPATRHESIRLESIRWERVQLIFEARVAANDATAAATIRLRHSGRGGTMRPTRMTLEGDHLTLRFNVMVGPDLQPLAPGRWTLAASVVVADEALLDPRTSRGVFTLLRGRYEVTPGYEPGATDGGPDGGPGQLHLDVAFDDTDRRPDDRPVGDRVRQRSRRPIVLARQWAFRALVSISKRLHRPGPPRVLFTSRLISEMAGNLKVVHDRMVERGLDRDHELVTMLKPGITERWSFTDRLRLARALATASVILIDDTFPPLNWVGLRPGVRIVQLWHASGAFKTVGYSRAGRPGDLNPFGTVHKAYTAAIVSSEFDVPFYAEAFGIPESRVIPTGIPRMDRFFDDRQRAAGVEAARAAFPETVGRMTILFAPTYRGETIRDASYGFEHLDYAALHALCIELDAVVIIRMHPFVATSLGIPEAFRDRLLDGLRSSIDINDLLFAVDLLVTDYSSIVFEYSTLGRPMLFFAYDLDEYVAARDFYVSFESFVPGRIVRTFDELLDAIRREDYELDKVADFSRRHFAHLDSGSTDRVIDQLVLRR
jgi:CDP-ribitol ribitolphosphotransferase